MLVGQDHGTLQSLNLMIIIYLSTIATHTECTCTKPLKPVVPWGWYTEGKVRTAVVYKQVKPATYSVEHKSSKPEDEGEKHE